MKTPRGVSTPRGPWPWMRGRPIRVVVRCHRGPQAEKLNIKAQYLLANKGPDSDKTIKQVPNQIVRPVVPRYNITGTIADGPSSRKTYSY